MSATERSLLCDLLLALGPDAPTLCEGWTTRDLAAHLVARERRPDTAPGFVLSALSRHSDSVRTTYLGKHFEELVALVRSGPPRWSPFGLPLMQGALNTAEFFVHHEDVRRAQEGWTPRLLTPSQQDELWAVLPIRAKIAFRRMTCGVVLQRSDVVAIEAAGDTAITAKAGRPAAVVNGEPQELMLFAYGRRAHARVKVTGPPETVRIVATLPLDD